MVMVSFKSKKDKEHLLEKARKMEEYSSMIVDCLEESDYMDDYEKSYRGHEHEEDDEMRGGRYGYRRYRMN